MAAKKRTRKEIQARREEIDREREAEYARIRYYERKLQELPITFWEVRTGRNGMLYLFETKGWFIEGSKFGVYDMFRRHNAAAILEKEPRALGKVWVSPARCYMDEEAAKLAVKERNAQFIDRKKRKIRSLRKKMREQILNAIQELRELLSSAKQSIAVIKDPELVDFMNDWDSR